MKNKAFCILKKKISAFLFLLFTLVSITGHAQYEQMLIGDNNNHRIILASIDGSVLDTIIKSDQNQSFYDADVDPVNKKIYMAWYWGIYSMNYDCSDFTTLVSYPAGGYSCGIAADPVNGYIYWGSTPEDKIYRANLDGSNQVTFLSGLGYVGDVDIDIKNGYLFYGQYIISDTKGLYRVNLNGTNNVTIATGYSVQYLGLDTKNSVIYFSDGGSCRKINYDGTNDNKLFDFQPGGFFIDTTNSLVYCSDMNHSRIISSDLFGANILEIITTNLQGPQGPVLLNARFSILIQPENIIANNGENVEFIVNGSDPEIEYQWQTDIGFGFQNLSNAGQYNGSNNDTLLVSNLTQSNNNQLFRCILATSFFSDTSAIAVLTVKDNTGIQQMYEQETFKIFPNPANGIIYILTNADRVDEFFKIYDQSGKVVKTGQILSNITILDLNHLPEGVYVFSSGKNMHKIFTLTVN